MTRPYTAQQAIAIIRTCHTVKDLDQATHLIYPYLVNYCLCDMHCISQVIFYRRKRLLKINNQ